MFVILYTSFKVSFILILKRSEGRRENGADWKQSFGLDFFYLFVSFALPIVMPFKFHGSPCPSEQRYCIFKCTSNVSGEIQ